LLTTLGFKPWSLRYFTAVIRVLLSALSHNLIVAVSTIEFLLTAFLPFFFFLAGQVLSEIVSFEEELGKRRDDQKKKASK